MLKGGLSAPDTVYHALQCPPLLSLSEHDRKRPQRARRIRSKVLSERCQTKAPIRVFGEDLDARQCSQDAVERVGMRLCGRGECGAMGRPLTKPISDAELGDHVQSLRKPAPGHHVE
jgi:hypothetical protein